MKRPWELLPVPPPAIYDPSEKEPDYFYKNFVLPLTKDFIRLMSNGIHMDQAAINDLRNTLDDVLENVQKKLSSHPIIIDFQEHMYPIKFKEYEENIRSTMKTPRDLIPKRYDEKNKIHRTYIVNTYLKNNNLEEYLLSEWLIKDVKEVNAILNDFVLTRLLNKNLDPTEKVVKDGLMAIAEEKCRIYNKEREDKILAVTREQLLPPFNPGSSKQKQQLFEFLKEEPLAFSKETGLPSWGRDQIEELYKQTTNEDYKALLQLFIDYSFGAIVRNNFIEAFDKYRIGNVLYGNFKLFGAKTFRPTSNNPNMLNAPSTKSIYAKPLKKCFVAPEGYIVWSIDYSALEDRVIANLSGDENKLAVFIDGIDGHSLGATYYFPKEVADLIGEYIDHKQAARDLKSLVDEGNKAAKEIRQKGKPVTFKLAYGGFPDSHKGGFITQQIFDAYHNEMYPYISMMRDEAMKQAEDQGYLHLGLGCRIYTDNVDKDTRTLFNALSQFWSILTLIAVNELHYRIDEANLNNEIKITSTIYDAIYGICKKDSEIIKWLNDTIPGIMEKDFLENQIVHNEANLEIGPNWSELTELAHNLTTKEIKELL